MKEGAKRKKIKMADDSGKEEEKSKGPKKKRRMANLDSARALDLMKEELGEAKKKALEEQIRERERKRAV